MQEQVYTSTQSSHTSLAAAMLAFPRMHRCFSAPSSTCMSDGHCPVSACLGFCCVSVCLCACLSFCTSACLDACLPTGPPARLCLGVSSGLLAYLIVCSPGSLSACLPVCLFLSVCLACRLLACLPVSGLPVWLCVWLFACLRSFLTVCLSGCLAVRAAVCLSGRGAALLLVGLSLWQPVHLWFDLPVLYVSLSLCPCVSLAVERPITVGRSRLAIFYVVSYRCVVSSSALDPLAVSARTRPCLLMSGLVLSCAALSCLLVP